MTDPGHSTNGNEDPAGAEGGSSFPSFDTMANLRALGEVQRRGLEAANQVIGRLVEQTDGPIFGAEPIQRDRVADPGRSTDPFIQFAELMRSAIAAMFGAMSNGASSNAAAVPDGISTDPLALAPTRAGDHARGELWVHNRSGAAVTAVHLHCGDLRRHDGWAVAADHVTFDPAGEFELPDRTSRGIGIDIAVDVDTPPGVYRGTVLASGLPEVWLPIELVVESAS